VSLREDQRGAILILGLFMALSLCGGLWMLLGIGDAVLTHDLGQEAADSGALSSAAVHARAMNATGAINMVMLVMVASYLSLCVVSDVTLALASYFVLFPRSEADGRDVGLRARGGYEATLQFEQGLGRTFSALDRAQRGLAVGAPYLGSRVANDVASQYRFSGVSLGWSNFSGDAVPRPNERPAYAASGGSSVPQPATVAVPCSLNNFVCDMNHALFPTLRSGPGFTLGNIAGRSLGLPVAAESNATLCVRAGLSTFFDLQELLTSLGIGQVAPFFLRGISGYDAAIPVRGHCSDVANATMAPVLAPAVSRTQRVWSESGPKRMTAANGDTVMRVIGWAVSQQDTVTDESLRRVKLGAYDLSGSSDRFTPVYEAHAEFFYDCAATWGAIKCNDGELRGTGVGYEHALYWPRWRARLVRTRSLESVFHAPIVKVIDLGGALGTAGAELGAAWSRISGQLVKQQSLPAPSLH
jgi:hypothetical protein